MSISSYIWRIVFQNSLSLFTFGELVFKILFLLSKFETRVSISHFLLEKGEFFCKFLFLLSKLEKWISNFSFLFRIWNFCKNFSFSSRNLRMKNPILFLFSKVENLFTNFSFSSWMWGKEIQSSLSLLQIGEKNFKFLFLFSIGLFGLSSMPGHPASHVTLWTSGGKFASGSNFKGGAFFS